MFKYGVIHIILVSVCFLSACGDRAGREKNIDDIMTRGPVLFAQYGCVACHSLEGEQMYGPSLNDLYSNEVTVIRNGRELSLVATRKYLEKAIMEPGYEKVLDYRERRMSQPQISRRDAALLVDYLIAYNKNH